MAVGLKRRRFLLFVLALITSLVVALSFILSGDRRQTRPADRTRPASSVFSQPASATPNTRVPGYAYLTYRNARYGIELQYRSDASITSPSTGGDSIIQIVYSIPNSSADFLAITAEANAKNSSATDFVSDYIKQCDASSPKEEGSVGCSARVRGREKIMIDGVPAEKVKWFQFDSEETDIYVPHGDQIFILSYASVIPEANGKDFQEVLFAIESTISTFHFLKD